MKNDQGAFAIVPADLFDLRVSGSAILVFTALATFAGKDRIVWPSLKTIGKMVGMKERSVRRLLGDLEAAGVVTRVARYDRDGRQLSNVYRLDILRSHLANRGDSGVPPGGDSRVPLTVPVGTEPLPPGADARGSEGEGEDGGEDGPSEFEQWYEHYPKRVSRGPAEEAFEKARAGGASLEELIAGAKRYAAQAACRGSPRFVKYPATWLNQKC